jgi:hypothetical protein
MLTKIFTSLMFVMLLTISMSVRSESSSPCGGSVNKRCNDCERCFGNADGSCSCRADPSCGSCSTPPPTPPDGSPNTGNQSQFDIDKFINQRNSSKPNS